MKWFFSISLIVVCSSVSTVNAETFFSPHLTDGILPQGVTALRSETRYGSSDSRFNSQGDREPLGDALDGIPVTNALVPALGVGQVYGVTDIDVEINGVLQRIIFGYGLTDNLTVGFLLPWAKVNTDVRFDLLPGNVGPNSPAVVNAALGAGFAYEPIQSESTSGLQDPVVGARWRVMQGDKDSLVLTGSVRFGMTQHDNPNNLMDQTLGDGTTDFISGVEYYRQLNDFLDIGLSYEHTWQTRDQRLARARAVGEYLVPSSRTEMLGHHKGQANDFAVELGVRVKPSLRLMTRVERYEREATDWTSPSGQDVSGLEANTQRRETTLVAGVSWSTINAYKNGEAALPIIVELLAKHIAEGSNTVQSTDYNVNLTIPFK